MYLRSDASPAVSNAPPVACAVVRRVNQLLFFFFFQIVHLDEHFLVSTGLLLGFTNIHIYIYLYLCMYCSVKIVFYRFRQITFFGLELFFDYKMVDLYSRCPQSLSCGKHRRIQMQKTRWRSRHTLGRRFVLFSRTRRKKKKHKNKTEHYSSMIL